MFFKMFLICLVLVALPFSALSSDVLEFTDSNFESKVNEHSTILVEFYAPWCGHCKRLAPEYEKAATTLKHNDPPISLAKVDCTAETKTCEKHGVSGYPTLKVFKGGSFAFDFQGDRSADGIVKYMISKSGPSSREITTVAEAEAFLKKEETMIVGFFEKENSDIQKAFQSASESLNEDFRFAHTYSHDVSEKYGYKDNIVLFLPSKLHSKFEESRKKYSGDVVLHKIKGWIEDNAMGLAGHRVASTTKFFNRKPLIVAYYDVDYEKNPKGTNYWRNRILKVAKEFLDAGKDVNFAVSSSTELSWELSEFGIESPDQKKVYIVARDKANQKYKMDGEFSMEALSKFLTDLLANKLTPYLKSEPVPEKNDDPVKVVVAKTFDSIVNDPSKDVMIEFYAPWCGHCKSLAPKYEEVAKTLSGESELVIAKMDATANDVPSPYQVQGYPTIYFAPKGSKHSPKVFSGGREAKEFIDYLAKESTNPLSGFDRSGKERKTDL